MGHACAKNIYDRLGRKLDSLTTRTPQNKAFQDILTELYTPAEAELVVKMPAGLSTLDKLVKTTRIERQELEPLLASACNKGLIIDLWLQEEYRYSPSPFVIGLFEFTMMRTGVGCDYKKWAGLFYEYLSGNDEFYSANGNEGAEALAEQASALQPDNAQIADTLGWIRVKKGDFSGGLPVLERASTQAPNDLDIQFHVAYTRRQLGDLDGAVTILKQILESGRGFSERDNAVALMEEMEENGR